MECRHETQKQIDIVPTTLVPKLTWRVISPYQMSGLHLAKKIYAQGRQNRPFRRKDDK